MPRAALAPIAFAAPLAALAPPAPAVESCELNGEHVNPKVVRDDEVFEDGSHKALGT